MNVGQLREFLKNVSDDAVVLIPAEDHSFEHRLFVSIQKADKKNGFYFEYYPSYPVEGKLVDSVVIG